MGLIHLAYGLAYAVRFYYQPFIDEFPLDKGLPSYAIYLEAAPLILCAWAFSLSRRGTYTRLQVPAMDELIRLAHASLIGLVLSMSAMFLYRDNSYSRIVFVLGGLISYLLLYVYRQTVKVLYVLWVRATKSPNRVLVLGNGRLSKSLKKILDRQGDRAILKKDTGDVTEICRAIARSRIQEVLVTDAKMDHKSTVKLALYCEERGVSLRIFPDIMEIRMGEVVIDDSFGIPMFQLKPVSLHGTAFLMKRIVDVALASLILGVLFVPLLVVAMLIKLTSSGPIFYKQARMGFRGRSFQFLKFRTMVKEADILLEELKKHSDRSGPVFKMKNDPRITIIGRFLRRYSIDEIPQFLNVLFSEMSLVDPRPQVLWEAAAYDEWAKKRLNVLPGITGLWQVSGRAELTYEEMIDLDVYYIEHWSPGLDFKILSKTVPAILMGKGAY
jgi:exopolysaccharide biosynthesis polyprenyl glycosylphosphotransferase